MNREIKFRAKDLQFNIWVYGMPVNSNCGYQMLSDDSLYHVDGAEWSCTSIDINKDTIGQYTGLKDKNGKEIYEGDILTHEKLHNTKYRMIFVMEWDNDRGAYSQYSPRQEFVVIGNIYENPELLK